jgi:hypothetical protein
MGCCRREFDRWRGTADHKTALAAPKALDAEIEEAICCTQSLLLVMNIPLQVFDPKRNTLNVNISFARFGVESRPQSSNASSFR